MGGLIGREDNSHHACFPYWTDFNLNWRLLRSTPHPRPHPQLINIIMMTLIGPSGPGAISKLYNFTQLQPAFWVNIASVAHNPSWALWRLTSSRTWTQGILSRPDRQLVFEMVLCGCLFLVVGLALGSWGSKRCSAMVVAQKSNSQLSHWSLSRHWLVFFLFYSIDLLHGM